MGKPEFQQALKTRLDHFTSKEFLGANHTMLFPIMAFGKPKIVKNIEEDPEGVAETLRKVRAEIDELLKTYEN